MHRYEDVDEMLPGDLVLAWLWPQAQVTEERPYIIVSVKHVSNRKTQLLLLGHRLVHFYVSRNSLSDIRMFFRLKKQRNT